MARSVRVVKCREDRRSGDEHRREPDVDGGELDRSDVACGQLRGSHITMVAALAPPEIFAAVRA
jgi:hypothetical protein